MGLTIYYELAADVQSADEAGDLMRELHVKAQAIDFTEVHDLSFYDEEEVRQIKEEEQRVKGGGAAYLLAQASMFVKAEDEIDEDDGHGFMNVEPECFHRFSINPGEGSEWAAIGLSRMPSTVEHNGQTRPTGLARWHWQSFCKTQYASNPKFGGIDNFLRCHLGLVELLDYASELGVLRRANDDSEYWDHRDEAVLREKLTQMNRLVASFTGAFKDAMGENRDQAVSPITDFPNFEHLEADQRKEE